MRNYRALTNLFLAVAACTSCTGCAYMHDCKYEAVQRVRTCNAWTDFVHCTGRCYSVYYRNGWKKGFYDVTTGGDGCPPLLAPECYHGPLRLLNDCDTPRHEWYVGFQDGVAYAKRFPDTHYLRLWNPPPVCPPVCQIDKDFGEPSPIEGFEPMESVPYEQPTDPMPAEDTSASKSGPSHRRVSATQVPGDLIAPPHHAATTVPVNGHPALNLIISEQGGVMQIQVMGTNAPQTTQSQPVQTQQGIEPKPAPPAVERTRASATPVPETSNDSEVFVGSNERTASTTPHLLCDYASEAEPRPIVTTTPKTTPIVKEPVAKPAPKPSFGMWNLQHDSPVVETDETTDAAGQQLTESELWETASN